MGSLTQEIQIDASAKEVWKVLSNLGQFWQLNPAIVVSYLIGLKNRGVGTERYCYLGNGHFLEEIVIDWQEPKQLTTRIACTSLPFKSGDLQLEMREERKSTVVTASSVYELEFGLIGRILDALFVGPTYAKHIADLLAGLKRHVEIPPGGEDLALPVSRG